ncbi:MAG TPA: CheR family methyltransferase [Xanthomonadaceae bacterium]|jgi:chemotaxis protein methyltransferase WspC|nr:CheR family methyltransferase [Xanthomonadaceae bacterium]
MSRDALIRLMQQRIGLDAASLGERVLNDALAESRAALGVADDEALYGKALVRPEAFADIVERFVVPESWFFRAPDQYADLVRFANEQRHRRTLRVLSLPCASGEEAYSAVIALVEAGWSAEAIDVLGIDISRVAIERAQAGTYRNYALRGRPMAGSWIQPQPGGFSVAAGIRRSARFRVGNALDPNLFDTCERFDVVFCRNLLIYLHAEARTRVLKTLLAVLEPWGLLFAGQAEVLQGTDCELKPYPGGCPMSYVRDVSSSPKVATQPSVDRPSRIEAGTEARPARASRAAPSPVEPTELSPQALADAGRLEEARLACERRLQRSPEDIDSLFLLGLIESARADLRAADEAFARVCFLDRDHLPAMDHRIALAERQGRPELAVDLRRRSERLRKRLGRTA